MDVVVAVVDSSVIAFIEKKKTLASEKKYPHGPRTPIRLTKARRLVSEPPRYLLKTDSVK